MTDQQKTDLDHAELGRLAEAADQPMPLKRRAGWWGRKARFEAAFTPAVCRALLSDNAALKKRADEAEDANTRWALLFADIRGAAGIGHKPMLSEVPDAIRALGAERDEAVRLLRLFDMHLGDDDAMWTDGSTVSGEWIRSDGIRQSLTFGLFRQVRTFLQSIARETGK